MPGETDATGRPSVRAILDHVRRRVIPDGDILNEGLPEGIWFRGGWIDALDRAGDAICYRLTGVETVVARLVIGKHADDGSNRINKLANRGVDESRIRAIDDLEHFSIGRVDANFIREARFAEADQASTTDHVSHGEVLCRRVGPPD